MYIEIMGAMVGRKKFLVVDDDVSVLGFVAAAVERMGHTVVRARHAEEALATFEAHRPWDGLITDIRMPDMDGFELGRNLVLRQPGLKMLFMSGFISDASSFLADANLPEDIFFLHKPFSLKEISEVIRLILVETEKV